MAPLGWILATPLPGIRVAMATGTENGTRTRSGVSWFGPCPDPYPTRLCPSGCKLGHVDPWDQSFAYFTGDPPCLTDNPQGLTDVPFTPWFYVEKGQSHVKSKEISAKQPRQVILGKSRRTFLEKLLKVFRPVPPDWPLRTLTRPELL